MTDDNVISLEGKVRRPWLTKENVRNSCQHANVGVNYSARVVRCRDCEVELDPIWVLDQLAIKERRLYYSNRDVKRNQELLQELKREERNIKARIRRARKKIAE